MTAVCLAAAVTTALAAGSYTVSACSPASTTGPWTVVNTSPAGLDAGQLCGGPAVGSLPIDQQPGDLLYNNNGAMYAQDNLNSSTIMSNGTQAGWLFTAPPQTTISAITYYRGIQTYGDPDLVSGLFEANGAPLEQCMVSTALGSPLNCSMPNNQAPVTFTQLNTSSLFFGVECRIVEPNSAGCNDGAAQQHSAQADLYSAQVTLAESATPTVSGAAGGLWGGGVIVGVEPVTFSASDPSGIQGAVVRSDGGQTVASYSQTCDFTAAVPCPQLPSSPPLSVNTMGVPDGPHTFTLIVADAAGNTQSVTSPSVVVDNNGPPAASAFTATAQGAGSNVVHLAWTNPASPPQPVTGAQAQLCQATCAAPVAVSPAGSAQMTAAGPGAYTVRLSLVDGAGKTGAAATVAVTIPPPASGGGGSGGGGGGGGTKPPTKTAVVHTKIAAAISGQRLRVSGTLAAVNNGKITVSWRSHNSRGRRLASGSRVVTIRDHKLSITFTLGHLARTGTVGVAVRSGKRVLAGAHASRPASTKAGKPSYTPGDLTPAMGTR
jgi:hypothetical protein